MVNIHLEKWLIRCDSDTKRAIWWDLYKKHISIFCIKHMSTIFCTLQVNKWQWKEQMFFSFSKINANKFGIKNEISHKIIYHYMTSYGYIITIIVDSCIIWFHLDCIMQLKKSYYIAINVSSRKNTTTFGDLPDCSGNIWTTYLGFMKLGSFGSAIAYLPEYFSTEPTFRILDWTCYH